jgi:hypothetical protein
MYPDKIEQTRKVDDPPHKIRSAFFRATQKRSCSPNAFATCLRKNDRATVVDHSLRARRRQYFRLDGLTARVKVAIHQNEPA